MQVRTATQRSHWGKLSKLRIVMTVIVALAILYQQSSEPRFLLQLRDDISTIAYPGVWGLFGGHLEPEETPLEGLKRELLEEINYAVASPEPFRIVADEQAIRHIFAAPLTVSMNDLILREGQDLGLLSPAEIRRGSAYSVKASQTRPIGVIHQRILLDFLREGENVPTERGRGKGERGKGNGEGEGVSCFKGRGKDYRLEEVSLTIPPFTPYPFSFPRSFAASPFPAPSALALLPHKSI